MAYSAPSSRSTSDLITAAIWNADVVANPIAIYAGAMSVSSQAVGDILYASSTTQLGRIAAVATGQVLTSAGTGTVPAWSSNVDLGGTLDVTGATTLDSTLTVVNDVAVDTDTLFVDVSEDKVYIGHTASVGTGADLQIANAGGVAAQISRWSNDAGGPNLLLMKSRAASVGGSAVIVADDDPLGFIQWQADDGTDQATSAASIAVYVDGTPGSNDMPARMSFATTADGAASPTEHMRIAANGRLGINLSDFNNIYGNIEIEGIGDDVGANMYGDDADAHQLLQMGAGGVGDASRRGVLKIIATDDASNASIAMGSVGGVSCDFNFFNRRPSDGLGQVMLRLKGDSSAEFPGVLKVTTGITSGTGSAVMVSQFNHTIDATDVSNGYVDVTTTINRSAYQSIEGGIYDVNTNVFHGGHSSSDNYITYINGYTNLIRTGLGGSVQASDVIKYVVWHVE